jgi:hypothetical protein
VLPQNEAGPSGAAQFGIRNLECGILCFFFAIPHSVFELPARSKKGGVPHGFCAQCPWFRAGQCLKFNRSRAYLAKSESGKVRRIGLIYFTTSDMIRHRFEEGLQE